ncbi:hypothetical protein TWF281_000308 [Arthrobotrys megalospora]
MSTNAAAHIVNLPTEIIFKILKNLDNGEQQGLEQTYNYPKATALGCPVKSNGEPMKRACTHGGGHVGNFDAISRCSKRLRLLCFPYLFRYLRINLADEEAAVDTLRFYLNSNWLLQYVRKLHFVMDIRAFIVAELPMSVMKPDLNLLMGLIVRFFLFTVRVEELHFIVRAEIVSNGLRRVFRRYQEQMETSLSNVRSLKFSAGSEWIIQFCGGYSGLQELENSPGLSGSEYIPYSIDFAREQTEFSAPGVNLAPRTVLSRIGDYRAANILKGINSLRKGPNTLTKVTIYGKFTRDGLNVFIKSIPFVSYLTIIGGVVEPNHAPILGQLPYLRLLSFERDLNYLRECFEICPESPHTLWHFATCIGTLQQMWSAARFVGHIVRDVRGDVLAQHTVWKDTWEGFSTKTLDFEMEMDES